MAKLLTGKEVVAAIKEDAAARVQALAERGVAPKLAIVRVGERPDDVSYERTAVKRAEGMGIAVEVVALPADTAERDLVAAIEQVNADASIHGCLLFRPLPAGMDEARVSNLLAPEKDVDGITNASLAGVFTGCGTGFPPATARACLETLDFYGITAAGKRVAVVGRSLVVGRPVALMLLQRNATVTMCHSQTENLAEVTRAADIVVCATGRARAFGAEYFSPGQTVLDVGINFNEDGICGDVAFESVEPVVGAATPVPGGIGSVTTSVMLEHVITAAERASGLGA